MEDEADEDGTAAELDGEVDIPIATGDEEGDN